MRLIRHPLVAQDLRAMAEHIVTVTQGDIDAALRRLDEVDAMLADIRANPGYGAPLGGPLEGWRARHGDKGRMITIVYREGQGALFVALVAFGGQDWMARVPGRSKL